MKPRKVNENGPKYLKHLKNLKDAKAYYKRNAGSITSDDFKILKTVTVGRVGNRQNAYVRLFLSFNSFFQVFRASLSGSLLSVQRVLFVDGVGEHDCSGLIVHHSDACLLVGV